MTTVEFIYDGEDILGFEMYGHSTESAEDIEGKIVCSAVSSAAYMTVNTATEIIGADAEIEVDDAKLRFRLTSKIDAAQPLLEGLWLHISQLAKEYKDRVTLL